MRSCNICYNKTANCMWVRQLGQNQSICLNLTQQNGDKDFSAKHDKSLIEGKEK